MLNVVTLLVPLLLAAAEFAALAGIPLSLPAIAVRRSHGSEPEPKPRLDLTVAIGEEGFVVAGAAPLLGCRKADEPPRPGGCTLIPLRADAEYCARTVCGSDPDCRPPPACHDLAALKAVAVRVKTADEDGDGRPDHGDVREFIVAPDGGMRYHVMVAVMDALREYTPPAAPSPVPLFPDVIVAGGIR
jgi:hypothetical protein